MLYFDTFIAQTIQKCELGFIYKCFKSLNKVAKGGPFSLNIHPTLPHQLINLETNENFIFRR